MRILVFDTETTGLPQGKNPSIYDTDKWPHVIQLSWIVYDTVASDYTELEDTLVRTPVPPSADSERIHGITYSMAKRTGVPIRDALTSFDIALRSSDIIVGHNVSFDKRMLIVESIRLGMRLSFSTEYGRKPEFCTMKNYVRFCAIEAVGEKGDKYLKYPRLSELYRKLFNEDATNAHNAMADVIMCLRCYCYREYGVDVTKRGRVGKMFRLYCGK